MRRLVPLCALALAACTSDFAPASFLDGSLRVLDIVADHPEIAGGQSTTLTIQRPDDSNDSDVSWARCTLTSPTGSGFVNPDCTTADTASYLVPLGTGPSVSYTMPPDTSPFKLGLPDASTGLYVPIRAVVTRGSEKITAFYRLRYYLGIGGQPPNSNPVFDTVSYVVGDTDMGPETDTVLPEGGDPFPVQRESIVRMKALTTPESAETYLAVTDLQNMTVEQKTESLRFLWYTDVGEWKQSATGTALPVNELDLTKRRPTGYPAVVHVYIVVRDERGGSAVTARRLVVQ